MGYEDRRKYDVNNESIGLKFLEKILLHKFPTYKPISDRELQRRGVDFKLIGKGEQEYLCDLKVAASRINKTPLGTGCLECYARYKDKKTGNWEDYTGWFMNDDEIANTLVILWVDKTKSGKLQNPEDITEAEVAFIRYCDIWEYLKSIGWNKKRLQEKILTEYKGHEQKIHKSKLEDNLWFNSPAWLYEQERPINILIGREKYKEISVYHEKYILNN